MVVVDPIKKLVVVNRDSSYFSAIDRRVGVLSMVAEYLWSGGAQRRLNIRITANDRHL